MDPGLLLLLLSLEPLPRLIDAVVEHRPYSSLRPPLSRASMDAAGVYERRYTREPWGIGGVYRYAPSKRRFGFISEPRDCQTPPTSRRRIPSLVAPSPKPMVMTIAVTELLLSGS